MSTRTEPLIAATRTTGPADPTGRSGSRPGRLARWAPAAAVAWSLTYLALGIAWLAGARGYPWHSGGTDTVALSLLDEFSPRTGAWLTTAVAAVALGLATASVGLSQHPSTGSMLRLTGDASIGLGAVLAVVVPDFRLLAGLGYTPILVVGWIVGFARDVSPAEAYSWPWINVLLVTLGGLTLVVAGAGWRRAGAQAARADSRAVDAATGWRAPERAARWGRVAVAVSVLVPLGYAVTRFAWFVGIPLGLTAESFARVRPIAGFGAGLGAFAVVGALLTLGLLRPWGEVFPRWVPGLGGRPVPVGLAVVPAAFVSVAVTSAGLMFVRLTLFSGLGDAFPVGMADVAGWLPEMFWPVWGAALGLSTYAYWLRRRGEAPLVPAGPLAPVNGR